MYFFRHKLQASNANNSRNFVKGKRLANISFGCILCTYIQFIAMFIILVVTVVVIAVFLDIFKKH